MNSLQEIWGHRIRYIKSKDGGNPIAVLFIHGLGSADPGVGIYPKLFHFTLVPMR